MKRAVVLVSGGLDSATTLAICVREGFEPYALSFDYGQRQNIEVLAAVATKAGGEGTQFRIHAPLLVMSKAQIIRKGIELGVDFTLTHTCYDPTPDSLACGTCDSCRIRLEGFREVGRKDPISYA